MKTTAIWIKDKDIEVTEKSEDVLYDYVSILFDKKDEVLPELSAMDLSIPLVDYADYIKFEKAVNETVEASIEDGTNEDDLLLLVLVASGNRYGMMTYNSKMYDFKGVN